MTRWGGKDPEMSILREIKVRIRTLSLSSQAKARAKQSLEEEAWTVRKMHRRYRPVREGKPGEGLRKHLAWPSSQWEIWLNLSAVPGARARGPPPHPPPDAEHCQEIEKQEKSLTPHSG